MIAVQGWVYETTKGVVCGEVSTFPVVAIRTTLGDGYSRDKPHDLSSFQPQCHSEAIEQGWFYHGTTHSDEFLVVTDDEIKEAGSLYDDESEYQIVVCSWPSAEDEARLDAIGDRLRAVAVAKVRARLASEAREQADADAENETNR